MRKWESQLNNLRSRFESSWALQIFAYTVLAVFALGAATAGYFWARTNFISIEYRQGSDIAAVIGLIITAFLGILFLAPRENAEQQNDGILTPDNFLWSLDSMVWIERELQGLNNSMHGEDRPPIQDPNFFQTFPTVLLESAILRSKQIEEAAKDLVRQTILRLRKGGNRNWDVPFRNPHVEFSRNLPSGEAGHIEFLNDKTVIRIHPRYEEDPFAIATILCHELAHFILDHNGFRKPTSIENEKLTDLFVFKNGQGLIYLQGISDITGEGEETVESKLGYLTIEEMAYAHVRTSSQVGMSETEIVPSHFRGKGFSAAKKALSFLKSKQGNHLSEILLCPNNHVLRISPKTTGRLVRCPKCKWEKRVWLRKSDQLKFLMANGIQSFDEGDYKSALESFRSAQEVLKLNSESYCWASRCLKKMGRHQDAIRELKRLLSISPEDEGARNEMKTLIY